MKAPLSANETEALSRFVSKLVEDVEKLASLFESRGADSTLAREAEMNLRRTLEQLGEPETFDIPSPHTSRSISEFSYNRLS